MIERQSLGKLTEFIPLFGADELIEVAPVVVLLLTLADLLKQRLLIETARGITFQLVAHFTLSELQSFELLRQRGQILAQGLGICLAFIQPFRTLLALLFQIGYGLGQQGAGFNLPLLQLLFAPLQLLALIVIQ
ncbi:hypothetical protein D3C80_951950 [compost metagenome]